MIKLFTIKGIQGFLGSIFLLATLMGHSQIKNTTIQQSQLAIKTQMPVKYTTPVREIIKSTTDEIVLKYNFNGFAQNDVIHNTIKYQFLHIDGFSKMGGVGNPALPAHNDMILIPTMGSYKIEITSSQYKTYDGYNIHPVLEDASDEAGSPEPSFTKNEVLYQTNAFYPASTVEIIETQKLRGTQFGLIQVRPVQHNPVTGEIRVYSSIQYKITFKGSKSAFNNLKNSTSTSSLKSMQGSFLNGNIIPSQNSNKAVTGCNYIIVTKDTYKAAADTLAKWKRQLGYSVLVMSKSSWTSSEVKDSIHNRYNSWTLKPDYFVIIGDHADVPAEMIVFNTAESYASDLYYACMDGAGDYIPEMAHGRISVNSSAQALSTIHKIVNYERNPVTDPSFYNKGTVASYFQDGSTYTSYTDGSADRRFIHTCEEVRDYMQVQGHTVDRIYEAYDNRTPTHYNASYYSTGQNIPNDLLKSNGFQWNGTWLDMNNSINEGRFLFVHRDHGYDQGVGYAHPVYVNAYGHVSSLANNDKLPVIFSINCQSGNYINDHKYPAYTECIAESFLRKTDGGGVGVVAPSFDSYSGYNDALLVGMIDAMWANPGLVPQFGSGGTSNPTVNTHADIRTLGDVLNQGLLRMTQTWASSARWKLQHEIYHYFGDPTMKIWTNVPTAITHNVLDTLDRITGSIQLATNISSGKAVLMINDTVVGETIVKNGTADLNFTYNKACTAVLTLSGYGYAPVIKKIYIDNRILTVEPSVQASQIDFTTSSKSVDLDVSWVNGDGDFRMVVLSNTIFFTDPVDGIEYNANSNFIDDGQQVVYNGTENNVTVTGLTENTTYWFRVYEYNNKGIYTLYTTFEEMNNPNNPDGTGTLPIELIGFNATPKAAAIELAWVTASEYNNDYFTLERSIDGFEFQMITEVQGAGTSNQTNNYIYLDKEATQGKLYYRLSQTDNDGTLRYFDIIQTHLDTENSTLEITKINVYDNLINIDLNLPQEDTYTCQISDINGRIVHSKQIHMKSGYRAESLSTNSLRTGIYMCTVFNKQYKEVKKFILR